MFARPSMREGVPELVEVVSIYLESAAGNTFRGTRMAPIQEHRMQAGHANLDQYGQSCRNFIAIDTLA